LKFLNSQDAPMSMFESEESSDFNEQVSFIKYEKYFVESSEF
jgi:hypothetical protein